MKLNFLVLAIFVTLCSHCFGADRYIYDIVQYNPSNIKVTEFRCYCTAITKQHALIPASCDKVQEPNVLGMKIDTVFGGSVLSET
jgi:hypothetical protein